MNILQNDLEDKCILHVEYSDQNTWNITQAIRPKG